MGLKPSDWWLRAALGNSQAGASSHGDSQHQPLSVPLWRFTNSDGLADAQCHAQSFLCLPCRAHSPEGDVLVGWPSREAQHAGGVVCALWVPLNPVLGSLRSKQYNRDTGLSICEFLHCFLFGSRAPWWRLLSEKRPSCVPAFVRHQNRKLLYASKA